MSEMVERVAVAYAKAWREDIKKYLGQTVLSWDEMGENQREVMRRCARDAIRAMREPTQAMVEAVAPVPHGLIKERNDPEYTKGMTAAARVDQLVARQSFAKMIDAALNVSP